MSEKRVRGRWDTVRIQIEIEGRSRTKQSFARDCDINAIVARFTSTGVFEHVDEREARYGDFTGLQDYQEAVNRVSEARNDFMDLPAQVRAWANNDPGEYLELMQDPANAHELREMGYTELADDLEEMHEERAEAGRLAGSSPSEPASSAEGSEAAGEGASEPEPSEQQDS